MLNRLSKKLVLFLIAIVLTIGWFLLPTKTSLNKPETLALATEQTKRQSLVSAIQPVSTADAADVAVTMPLVTAFTATQEFTARFDQANSYAAGDDINRAKLHYQDLIRDYPQAVEPYVNLAALYAQESQLDMAQQTLTDGINANQSYAALFTNLQKILGALAANAYKDALQEESGKITSLRLPLLQTVQSGGASSQQMAKLRQQLQEVRANTDQSQKAALISVTEQEKMEDLRFELRAARQSLQTLKSEYQSKLDEVQAKLDEQTLAASNLAVANQKQQSEIALSKQLVVAKQAKAGQAEQERLAVLQAERDSKAKAQALAVARQQAQQSNADERKTVQLAKAVAQVNRWAQAWSAQSVTDYVASYSDGYTPAGSALSHEQWLQQRRVRLTNKSFIRVKVSDFKVSKTTQGFDVLFLQHYKADNIDDRIRKRLSFAAPADDWGRAKIIRETIVK